MEVEYLLKTFNIEILLLPEKQNVEKSLKIINKELFEVKEKVKNIENNFKEILNKQNEEIMNLKEDNKNLNKQIKELIKLVKKNNDNSNNNLDYIDSVIIKEKELDLIKRGIKERMNKDIKQIKKLYRASEDGGDPNEFHKRCDNIPNTLILIKSKGNRRFGGFASVTWETPKIYTSKIDINSFLFSLDKNKIYPRNVKSKADNCCWGDRGPSFGSAHDISISGNAIKEKELHTKESSDSCSYDYNGDKNALSEDGEGKKLFAIDYEVFQIIF